MKKNYFISAMMLLLPMLACALTPAELAGTWTSDPVELMSEGTNSLSVVPSYTINPDGTFTDTSTMVFNESQMGIVLEYKIRTEVAGTYTISGDNMNLTYDYDNATFTCAKEDVDIKGDMPSEQKSAAVDTMVQMMNSMVIPQMKTQAASDPKEAWDNVSVTASTLSYEIDGKKITLTKK